MGIETLYDGNFKLFTKPPGIIQSVNVKHYIISIYYMSKRANYNNTWNAILRVLTPEIRILTTCSWILPNIR